MDNINGYMVITGVIDDNQVTAEFSLENGIERLDIRTDRSWLTRVNEDDDQDTADLYRDTGLKILDLIRSTINRNID